jgi:hypothetical protein
MNPTMPHIDADDVIVEDLLAGTLELVAELGGWLHPQARIVARDGQLGLHCGSEDDAPLVHLPREAFVRIGRVTWSHSREGLEVLDIPAEMTDAEAELLMLQVALHNQSGKIPWLVRTHPVLDPLLPDDVIEAVRWFRPSFRLRQPTPASLLWSTRSFRVPVQPSSTPEPAALPIIDLLNHHHSGSTGQLLEVGFAVDVSRPFGTDECALDYGLGRDAIGMAVVYGFADSTAAVAHSAPLVLQVPRVGEVRVAAVGRTRTGQLLPPVVREQDGLLEISHVTFRPGNAGQLAARMGASVVEAVAERNLELLAELRRRAQAAPGSAGAAVLAAAADRQAEVITAGLRAP